MPCLICGYYLIHLLYLFYSYYLACIPCLLWDCCLAYMLYLFYGYYLAYVFNPPYSYYLLCVFCLFCGCCLPDLPCQFDSSVFFISGLTIELNKLNSLLIKNYLYFYYVFIGFLEYFVLLYKLIFL